MKKLFFLVFALAYTFNACAQSSKKVLLIGIDGCRPDALQIANTPTLDGLINNGIYSPHALNDDITISGPGWSAILCGVWSEKHLVFNNNFDGNDYENYPPITKYINDFAPEMHTVSICHWAPINNQIIADHIDFKLNVSSDAEVASQAGAYVEVNDPDFIFLHFDDVDHAGHSSGFDPENPEYISAIESIDALIASILFEIEQRPDFFNEDWLILVTTDHGGLGNSHGGTSQEEEEVFVIASGNNIAQTLLLRDSMIQSDSPFNCLGDSIELQFDGQDDAVQIPNNPLFNFGSDQDFTVELRVRTNVAADVAMVGNKDWDSGVNKGFVFSFKYPSGPEWKVNIGDGTNRADINTGGLIADNEWHTLSVSFDRDGLMTMYQGGIIIDQTDISFIGDITTNEGFFFGTDINGGYDFNGSIAEVRVWDKVLDTSVITDWQCISVDNTHPDYSNLIGYWKLNEGSGTTATDFSINENNGTFAGAEWEVPDSSVVYDYSNTPRLVDVPVTALTHLCIPIDGSMDFDGSSLIPECMSTGTINYSNDSSFKLFPNPVTDYLEIEIKNLNSESTHVEIFQSNGKKLFNKQIVTTKTRIDISTFPNGVYFFHLEINGQKHIKKFVKTGLK